MATALQESVVQLSLAQLVPSPHNPPGRDRDVGELAESIKSSGIIEPLIVVSNGAKAGTHAVVAGHRRLAAARLAGLKTVPCIVRVMADEGDLLSAMLIENLQRKDLEPLQEAAGYGQLAKLEWSTRQIAAKVGKSQPHVVKRLGLLKLSPYATEQFGAGKLTVEDAGHLAALPLERQDRVLKEITWGTVESRIRELAWRDEEKVRRAAEAKKPKPKLVQPARRTTSSGNSKAEQERRAKETQLRDEATAARAKVLPRLLSRGERELQYAAAVLVDAGDFGLDWDGAYGLLKLKRGGHGTQGLIAHASKSKKAAIDTLLALAIATAEQGLTEQWGGDDAISKLHIGRLQKVGYKPTEHDLALLKAKRR